MIVAGPIEGKLNRCSSLPTDRILLFRIASRTRRVELLIEPGQSLGLMIRGGVEYGLGIFITGVDKDSVADRAGLMVRKMTMQTYV